MKKSIVLLITLLFISAISILIFKNLSSGESYLNTVNKEQNNTQVILLVKNAQEELLSYFSKNDVYDALVESGQEEISLPLHIKDIEFRIKVSKYKKELNINDFSLIKKEEKELFLKKAETLFNENYWDFSSFLEVVNQYFLKYKITVESPIINSKQINNIISDYSQKTYLKEVNNLIDKIGFLPRKIYDTKNKTNKNIKYLSCSLYFKLNKEEYRTSFILDLEKKIYKTGVIDFDFTFK